jgi:hypothetical protein
MICGKELTMMTRRVSISLCFAATLLALGGCAEIPPDYSPGYHYVAVPAPTPRRPDRVRYVLVPDACTTFDPTAATPTGPLLPAGCANAYNLQRMTEREQDLVKGRSLGRAPAAPTIRAAEKYIYGGEGPLGASVGKPSQGPATTQEEAAPTPAEKTPKSQPK